MQCPIGGNVRPIAVDVVEDAAKDVHPRHCGDDDGQPGHRPFALGHPHDYLAYENRGNDVHGRVGECGQHGHDEHQPIAAHHGPDSLAKYQHMDAFPFYVYVRPGTGDYFRVTRPLISSRSGRLCPLAEMYH